MKQYEGYLFYIKLLTRSYFILTFAALIIIIIKGGCKVKPLPAEKKQKHEIPLIERIMGYSVENRPIKCLVIGNGIETVLLIASVHGDEVAGAGLLQDLAQFLLNNQSILKNRTVVLLPQANPDGLAAFSRYNSRNVDLNRNFPAKNRKSSARAGAFGGSEPESRVIIQLIEEYQPERILTIHEPLSCIDYDGPGEELAGHIAQYSNLDVKKLGAMPGSLGSYAGICLGIPVITLELPEKAFKISREKLWGLYGNVLIASVIYPDNIENYALRPWIDDSLTAYS